MKKHKFAECFKTAVLAMNKEAVLRAYKGETSWHKFMGKPLREAYNKKMGLRFVPGPESYRPESDKIDHAFCSGRACAFAFTDKTRWYPERLELLAEVENGPWPEKEIWKLAHWRSPVKSLFIDETLARKREGRKCLKSKLRAFSEFLEKVNKHHAEESSTRYFIFVTDRPQPMGDLRWHVYVLKPDGSRKPVDCFSLTGSAKTAFV